MVIDFSKIDFTKRPKFILKNLDDTAIGYLSNVLNPSGKFCYNEISEITFEYPSQIDGEALDEYDLLTGMRIIDVLGYGQFILRNPEETDNGIVKIKKCKAYSLEHELTYKNITLEEGTYCFWNPVASEGSVLGIIMSEVPSWTIGTVSKDLIGKYRTFSVSTKNVYDWIKSDLQETYNCIFDFDTYNRKINVRSIKDIVNTKPVYLSTKNLIKEIQIEENTDDLVTALDVYGADGVTIRSANPMGSNRIYNLDAYMNKSYFSDEIVSKWGLWKKTFESYQQPYYQLIVAQNMQISRYTTEESVLTELKGDLLALEAKQSTIHQALAIDEALESELDSINSQISAKNKEIALQENLLKSIQTQIDGYTAQLKSINQKTSFDTFFSSNELKILDKYFKCGSLTDSSFVATSKDAYAVDTKTVTGISATFNLTDLTSMTKAPYGDDVTFYIVRGGSIDVNTSNAVLKEQIVNGTLQVNNDKSFVFSLYLNKGTFNGTEYPSGTLAMTGSLSASVTSSESSLQFQTSSATLYLTQDVTEYQKMSIELELFKYGFETLKKLASPDFSFSTSVVNFIALDEYVSFAKELSLGDRAYLHIDKGVVTPIVTSVEIDFDDLTDFTIEFGNAYKLNDASFKLEDLLDQSISTGSSLDFNQYNYSSFTSSGAKTQVKDFMISAIDTMKNKIMSGLNNELTIDQTGLRCRKYDPTNSVFSPKQLWLSSNSLMFTNDNWNSATIGIGEFVDKNLGSIYGIIAPAIVGTILAGSNLIIETEGGFFRVDSNGVRIDSLKFMITNGDGGSNSLSGILDKIDSNIITVQNNVDKTNTSLDSLLEDFKSVTTKTSSGITLNSSDLKGIINAQQSQMQSAGGNVLFDEDGLWLMNSTSKSTTTKAVWMNENGIMFGAGPKANDPASSDSEWIWTTAIGHDGITTEALKSKTLNSATIVGGKITIGKDSDSDKEYLEIDTDGSLGIGKSTSGKWNFHVNKDGKIETGWNGNSYNFVVDTSGNISANSITVTNGMFTGTLNAPNLKGVMKADSDSWLEGVGIRVGKNSNATKGYNFYVDSSGNVTMNGSINLSNGSIKWGASNSPVKYQFSVNGSSEWHDTMQSSDKFRRDSLDGGVTWGQSYQFRGTDGKPGSNGSDANVSFSNILKALQRAESTKNTFITANSLGTAKIYAAEIYSPTIYSDEFVVMPKNTASSGKWTGGYSMYGYCGSELLHMLSISYKDTGFAPVVEFWSPVYAEAYWSFGRTTFSGILDFSSATIEGMSLTATFG